MIRRLPQNFINLIRLQSCRALSQTSASTTELPKEKWDLYASVVIERLPIISKSLTAIEKEFQSQLWQVEFEHSLKSDHELKHEKDLLQAELLKKGDVEIDLDEVSSKQTAQDLKDAYVEEFKKFQLAPRETADDQTDNLRSTNRKLEDVLYLLVEQTLGEKSYLMLPQGQHTDGETLRQTAERVVKERIGANLDMVIYGNAPVGFHKYKYPATSRKDSVGAKVFFFRSALKSGNVDETISKNFEWHNKESLKKKLQGSYSESIEKFLY